MKLLDDYFKIKKEIHDYFGYQEDWVVIPLDDARECYWNLNEYEGEVKFAENKENVFNGTMEDGYMNEIYTQRFLDKYVYRTEHFTMICVDTNTDGNKFLQVFDNSKEIK